ncbi:hypothetical protein [Propionivibrio dicarboxylicus]|uniref:Uncharacterized protein n=1 Tax=Propionivibrio dicarboxylicus TaxID=83767 RepID=A0A1G7X292_9RHOO|nr:hypothetical protein [Propionivibrio dicarboxylicus]SDG78272.1 hypothetical protein SAMN05660652_00711 [Propionivibrio dicarboxylicus]
MYFGRKSLVLLCALFLSNISVRADISEGDCVVLREGGEGRLLKSPTFWVKGVVSEIHRERQSVKECPAAARAGSAVTREALWQLARATPCVFGRVEGDSADVDVTRARIVVESWETPWTAAHGETGLLFRGTYIGEPLIKGGAIEMPVDWLKSCAVQP